MITIYLNDKKHSIKAQSLQEFLAAIEHTHVHCALAINSKYIPRTAYHEVVLAEGDRVDIIVPMQGG